MSMRGLWMVHRRASDGIAILPPALRPRRGKFAWQNAAMLLYVSYREYLGISSVRGRAEEYGSTDQQG